MAIVPNFSRSNRISMGFPFHSDTYAKMVRVGKFRDNRAAKEMIKIGY